MRTTPFVPTTALEAAALAIATERFEGTHPLEVPDPGDHDLELAELALTAARDFEAAARGEGSAR